MYLPQFVTTVNVHLISDARLSRHKHVASDYFECMMHSLQHLTGAIVWIYTLF